MKRNSFIVSSVSLPTAPASDLPVNVEGNHINVCRRMAAILYKVSSGVTNVRNEIVELVKSCEEKSLPEIQSCIAQIDSEIHANVTRNHHDLLAQTTNVELMDDVVMKTLCRTKTCLANVQNTGHTLEDLYKNLEESNMKLENLYTCRRLMFILMNVLKYNGLIEGEKNLSVVAMHVANIEMLCSSSSLEILKPYKDKANSLSLNIEKQTENMMMQALAAGSPTQVSSALQILVNLGKLKGRIENVLNEIHKQLERDVKTYLNFKQVGSNEKASTNPSQQPGRVTNSSRISEKLKKQVWFNLESLSTKLVAHTGKIKFLAHVMKTHKDLNTNFPFDHYIDTDTWRRFWDTFTDILVQNLGTNEQADIKSLFEDEFPKLLSIIASLGHQIENCTGLAVTVSLTTGLRGVTINYEKAFLSKSLKKLIDCVSHMFAKSPPSCPTNSEIDLLIGLINKESVVEDTMLRKLVARNISKTVQVVCVEAEKIVYNDGSATQVIGPATEAQVSNSRLANILEYFRNQLKPENSELVVTLIGHIINPLVQAISETVEAIILTMHQENFTKRTGRTVEYSLYMGELSTFLMRVSKDYISLYKPNETIHKSLQQLSNRTIKLLLNNMTLIPSLENKEIRKQFVIDLNHIETALLPISPILHEGLRLLRGFKNLLQMKPEEISNSNLIGPSLVPHSLALHLIINQTNGEIGTPNSENKWSIPRYLRWLEEHSERERLELIKTSIESYVDRVKVKGLTKFNPLYLTILELIKDSFTE